LQRIDLDLLPFFVSVLVAMTGLLCETRRLNPRRSAPVPACD
jgi:hypothetical protein